jgi:hypothetical protein
MLIFIDESGDAGFKNGSSKCFIIALIIFSCNEDAEKTDKAIERLKIKSGVKPEYKFSKTKDTLKEGFFECVGNFDFKISAIVVNKDRIFSPTLQKNPKKFYNFFLKQIIQKSGITRPARVKIDRASSRIFQQETKNYLCSCVSLDMRNIKFENSKSNNLIQLADMVSGAIARTCDTEKHDCNKWIDFLKGKFIKLWDFK